MVPSWPQYCQPITEELRVIGFALIGPIQIQVHWKPVSVWEEVCWVWEYYWLFAERWTTLCSITLLYTVVCRTVWRRPTLWLCQHILHNTLVGPDRGQGAQLQGGLCEYQIVVIMRPHRFLSQDCDMTILACADVKCSCKIMQEINGFEKLGTCMFNQK